MCLSEVEMYRTIEHGPGKTDKDAMIHMYVCTLPGKDFPRKTQLIIPVLIKLSTE